MIISILLSTFGLKIMNLNIFKSNLDKKYLVSKSQTPFFQ